MPGVPTPSFNLGFTKLSFDTDLSMYAFLAFWYFVGLVIALRIVRSPVGAIFRALRDNPLRASALGHNIHGYKLTAFVVAAAYAGFAGGLLAIMQGFMPPDAFMFDTSGQLVMQTAIGGAGTLFGPTDRRRRMALSKRLPSECAAPRRNLEARPRHRVRAARLLLEAWNCRRHRRSLSAGGGPSKDDPTRRDGGQSIASPATVQIVAKPMLADRRPAEHSAGPILEAIGPHQALWRPGRQQRYRFRRQSW